jgi:hypothetical protein
VGRVVGDYIRDYQIRRQKVLINVPPAIVRHLHFKPDQAARGRPKQLVVAGSGSAR